MLVVQMRSSTVANEELTTISVGASIGHAQHALVSVGIPNLLIIEVFAIDGVATGTVASSGVTALRHKALDHAVELVAFVVKTLSLFLSSAKGSEVFTCFWHICEKFKDDALLLVVLITLVTDAHVKEDLRVFGLKVGKL